MTESTLQPGVLLGKYRIEALLGEGGAARVYRARHASLGTLHAVKVLSKVTARMRDRLLLEGQVQASLSHPNIVRVVDVDEIDGFPCLVMEYIDGPTLADVIRDRPLPLPMVQEIGTQVLRGMAYAHDRGLVHRDLKPGNVLLARDGDGVVAKIADFGLVKVESNPHSATRTGTTMGTPLYMSPEQIRCAKHVDARTDVFSLGTMLYTLLAGKNPFQSDDLYEVFNRIVEQQQLPIAQVAPEGTPQRLLDTVREAMQVELDGRFMDAGEMLESWTGEKRSRVAADADLLSMVSAHSASIENEPTSYPEETGEGASPAAEPARPAETLNYEDEPLVTQMPTLEPAPDRRPLYLGAAFALLGLVAVAGVLLFVGSTPDPVLPEPVQPDPVQVAVPDAPPPVPAPVPEGVPATEPVVEPAPAAVPTPRPAPVVPRPTPRPVAPTPTPPAPEPVVPKPSEPEPVEPEPVEPEPVAAPTPEPPPAPTPTTGTVTNGTPGVPVFLRNARGDFRPGTVEPGTYTIIALFGGKPTPAGSLTVQPGSEQRIDCKPGLQLCQVH